MRATHMLTLSKPRTTIYGLPSFSYFPAQQWNALPYKLTGTVPFLILSDVCSLNTFA